MAADDVPRCTLGPPTAPSTCYCTNRPGCPYDGGDDVCVCGDVACPGDCEEPDDDAGHGDSWPPGVVVVTEFSDRGLL